MTPALRILIAEDNEINQLVLSSHLQRHGHLVVVTNDGREAVAAFRQSSFDVVLMDIQMPEMDGFEAVARIRSIEVERGTHTPIIAVTAHAMRGYREKCIAAGMDDHVSKPFKIQDLLNAVYRLALPASVIRAS
jgi:two-component system sensor histidine kinase/response regulator